MAALINTLDSFIHLQIGEKGHVEYGWSNCIQELILQYSFQLTRTNEFQMGNLKDTLKTMLSSLKRKVESATSTHEKELLRGYLSILYKMIGHTRDIIDGKGEYTLTYMMIYTWHDFYPELAKFALKCIVDLGDNNIHQYGSWKDIKYFCEYCRSQGDSVHPLIKYAVELINKQLREDNTKCIYGSNDISLVAKWIPRESSSFGWLYKMMATDYFPEYIDTPFKVQDPLS
jgi:hypothetical protein